MFITYQDSGKWILRDGKPTRDHLINVTPENGAELEAIVRKLHYSANSSDFGGVAAGKLLCVDPSGDRSVGGEWICTLTLREALERWDEPPVVLNCDTGELIPLSAGLYGLVDFSDYLPPVDLCGAIV